MNPLRLGMMIVAMAGMSAGLSAAGAEKKAAHILQTAGLRGGVIAHLDCGGGKLTAELGRNKRFIVHGLSADAKEVGRAREYIRSQGFYGRVSVERGSFERLPYAANLVNLMLVEDGPALLAKGLSPEEVFRVLVPRGTACFGVKGDEAAEEDLRKRMKGAGFGECRAVPYETGRLLTWRKPRPRDVWAGPPQNLQWLTKNYTGRWAGISSACGRIFHRMTLP